MADADRDVIVRVGAELDPSVAAAAREVRDQIAEAARPAGAGPGAGLPETLREAADAAGDIRPPVGDFAALESILGPIASKLGTSTVSLLGWASAIGAAVPVMVELYGQYSEVQEKADALLKTNIDAFDPKRLSAFVGEMLDATDKLNNMSQVALSALFKDATGKAAGEAIVASMDKAAEAVERYKVSVGEQLDIQEMILDGREREAAIAKAQAAHERAILAARAEYDAHVQKHPGDAGNTIAWQLKMEKEILADRALSLELRQAEHALLLREQRESDRGAAAARQHEREIEAGQKTADLERKKFDAARAGHRASMEDARAEGEIRRAAARGDAEGAAILRERSRLRAEIRRIGASDRTDAEKQSAINQAQINADEAIAEISRRAAEERKRGADAVAEEEERAVRAARARIDLQILAAAGDKAAIQDAKIRLHYEEMIADAITRGASEKTIAAIEAERDAALATARAEQTRESVEGAIQRGQDEAIARYEDLRHGRVPHYTDASGITRERRGSIIDEGGGPLSKSLGSKKGGWVDAEGRPLPNVGDLNEPGGPGMAGDSGSTMPERKHPFKEWKSQQDIEKARREARDENKEMVRKRSEEEGISPSDARKALRKEGKLIEPNRIDPDIQKKGEEAMASKSGGKRLDDLHAVLTEIRNRLPPGFGP